MRVGLLAKKIGMTRIFDEFGNHIPVTVVECPEAVVTNVNHNANGNVQIASFETTKKHLNKPQISEFDKIKSTYKRHRVEFKTDSVESFEKGKVITVDHFVEGQYIDVRGQNIGKGFAGGMKRHGFGGLEATHGVSISHRSHGSTGQCQDPGRVFKGKKMAGQMGAVNITAQNLEIVKIDSENSLIFIYGAIPGHKGTIVTITDAVKKALPQSAPQPAFFKGDKKDAEAQEEATETEAASEEVKAEEAPAEAKADEVKEEVAAPAEEVAETKEETKE